MRPSRSHESLASPLKPTSSHELQPNQFTKSSSIKSRLKLLGQQTPSSKTARLTATSKHKPFQPQASTNSRETIHKFSLLHTDHQPVTVRSIHTSLFNEANCLELKSLTSLISVQSFEPSSFETDLSDDDDDDYADYDYADDEYQQKQQYRHARHRTSVKSVKAGSGGVQSKYSTSAESYSTRYFLCRSGEEREKWVQCLKSVAESAVLAERRHAENSMQVWLLEAKGQAISVKATRKYFCEVFLNNTLCARTCCKERKEILFWGESFEFR
jgi:hypothetical protein